MASGHDPQSLILVFQVGKGYFCEPDGAGGGLRMRCTMALYVATKVSVMKPQIDPARAFMTLGPHGLLDSRGHEGQR